MVFKTFFGLHEFLFITPMVFPVNPDSAAMWLPDQALELQIFFFTYFIQACIDFKY